jgi:hypothetical protein
VTAQAIERATAHATTPPRPIIPPMAFLGRPSERDDARAARYAEWFARQHPLALPSILLSAFSLTHFGTLWLDEIAGIVLGVLAVAQIRRARDAAPDEPKPAKTDGLWLAWGGIVLGVISLVMAVLIYFVLPGRT